MKKNSPTLTKKDIQETFQKLAVKKKEDKSLKDWIELSSKNLVEKSNVWIIADTTSSFTSFNQE